MEKGPTAISSICPQHKCGEIIPARVFARFLDAPTMSRYRQYAMTSFVQGVSNNLNWCPAPACPRAIECPSAGGAQDVTCACGNRFCFGCERVAHRPVPCDLVEQWQAKNASESENANWIMANTKVCPVCKVPIEKNQGCNHMVCRMCKHEWCWLCKGAWSEHGSATGGFYNCNKFSDKERRGVAVDDEAKSMDKASSTLNRYLHYFSRFDNHAKAVKFAEKTLVQTEQRMRELQDLKGVGFMDVQFLLNAVTTVISCRHVLQWTYAYGYYLKESPSKALFETYQEQLEKFCEHLHELAEKPLAELQQIRLRTDVINYTRVTERYRDNIVRAIENNFQDA
jgi:ariadne-1